MYNRSIEKRFELSWPNSDSKDGSGITEQLPCKCMSCEVPFSLIGV